MADNGHSKAWLIELIPLAIMGIKKLFQRKHVWDTIEIANDNHNEKYVHLQRCSKHKNCYRIIKVNKEK